MITAKIRFTGIAQDGAELYRSYYLVADDDGNRGPAKSSVIPMSAGATMPETDHFNVKTGGQKAALDLAIKLLTELPGNQGLGIDINYTPA
jgi:hypothetical protein